MHLAASCRESVLSPTQISSTRVRLKSIQQRILLALIYGANQYSDEINAPQWARPQTRNHEVAAATSMAVLVAATCLVPAATAALALVVAAAAFALTAALPLAAPLTAAALTAAPGGVVEGGGSKNL